MLVCEVIMMSRSHVSPSLRSQHDNNKEPGTVKADVKAYTEIQSTMPAIVCCVIWVYSH